MQFQVGERKKAIRSRRLQDEDIMATCIRHIILQAVCNSKSATPRWRHHGDMYTTYHLAGSMQFKNGDSKMKTSWRHIYDISYCRQYAVQSRRLQDKDIMATPVRHILLAVLAFTYLCDVTSESRVHFSANWWRKHCENVKMSCKIHAVEHKMANKASKEGA